MIQGDLLAAMRPDKVVDWTPPDPPDLTGVDSFSLDFETTGLKWWASDKPIGAAVATPDGRRWYLPWGHRAGNLDEGTVKRWFQEQVRGKKLSNLNARFDNHMAYKWGVDLEAQHCTWTDVGHQVALLDDHRRQFNLEGIAQDYLGVGKVDLLEAHVEITKLAEHHAGEVAEYAMRDVELVDHLLPVLKKQLDLEELGKVKALEDDVIFVVCEMERNAAPMDTELLKRWVVEAENAYIKTLLRIHEITDVKVNPDSRIEMEKLFKKLGLENQFITATGMASFSEEALEIISAQNDDPRVGEVLDLVLHARKLDSLRSKYIDKYSGTVGPDGLLRYALHQLRADEGGTVSGRFSSSGIKVNGETIGCNIQQVPAVEKQRAQMGDEFTIRRLFRAGQGLVLSADAAQIEYRLFAHYLNDANVLQAYVDDPRTNFHKLVHKFITPHNESILYKVVKNTNFAFVYGAGPKKIAQTAGISLAATEELLRLYDRLIPGARQLIDRASRAAESRGYVRTLLGRRSRFPNGQRLHKALNGIIQGGAADLMKLKLVELHRERKHTGLLMRYTVHDEVVGDVPDIEAATRVQEILDRQSIELRVPILWDVATGETWADAA
jgi:DNA polymerase-1